MLYRAQKHAENSFRELDVDLWLFYWGIRSTVLPRAGSCKNSNYEATVLPVSDLSLENFHVSIFSRILFTVECFQEQTKVHLEE